MQSTPLRKRVIAFYDWLESPFGAMVSIFGALIATILLAILAGCASITPSTFNEKLAASYSSVTTIVETTTILLQNKKISIADAVNIKQQAQTAKDGLDIAKELHAKGAIGADDKLTASIVIIQALQKYLAAHPS